MSRRLGPGKGRQLGLAVLLAAALATIARVVQLACAPAAPAKMEVATSSVVKSATDEPASAPAGHPLAASFHQELESELARLYMACPAAAVVDLEGVVQCAVREGTTSQPHATVPGDGDSAWSRRATTVGVPRLSYPAPVRAAAETSPPVGRVVPTTEVPRISYPAPVSPRVASLERSAVGVRVAQSDGWLVDPNQWYSPEDRQKLGGATPSAEQHSPAAIDSPGVSPGTVPADQVPEQSTPAPAPPTEADPSQSVEPVGPELRRLPMASPVEPEPADPVEPTPAPVDEPPTPTYEELPAPANSAVPPTRSTTEMFTPPVLPDAPTGAPPPLPPAVPPVPPRSHPPTPPSGVAGAATQKEEDPHAELIARNRFPSARECAKCHEKIYEEWASSSHAYAAVSPMFQKFEQKITELSQGTVGYFCYRCHAPVGTTLGESRIEPLWNLAEVSREGVTCIACHRVQERYVKTNGERRIEEGPIFAPVFGSIGGDGVAEVVHNKDHYKVKTGPHEKGPGQDIHVAGLYHDQLGKSEFCQSCHQVAVHPGIKLEVVWEQYRASPACKQGIRCQDCHMGRIPGVPSGFEIGPAAEMTGKKVNEHRKHSNHVFYGPGYSIAHPGIFPFHLKANRWTMDEWLLFDWRAGWGTDEFEDAVADGKLCVQFPEVWKEADDRYDAREIIDDNFKKLAAKKEIRRQVMENGSHVDGPFFDGPLCRGQDLNFHYIITNTNNGHNLPSGSLGAQPQLWANVVLIAPDGRRIWESGYTDSYGDVADIHSVDVRNKRVPFDWQLFNLQTMFLITGAKGTDREFYLPVNVDIDQLPFLRPGAIPISVTNHPPFIRMEGRSLPPLGSRKVPYRVPGELMRQPGTYRLSFRMRSRAEPMYFMRFVGATVEMQRAMNEWMLDVHPYSVEFFVE